jgi:predicted nuclease of predicted toxin-antitoxin system
MITIVADESIDKQIVNKLREGGYTVFFIAEDFPSLNDEDVLIKANDLGSIMITGYKDFGELIYNRNMNAYGVILIRLAGVKSELKAEIVLNAIKNHENELKSSFTVISKNHIRIRKLN